MKNIGTLFGGLAVAAGLGAFGIAASSNEYETKCEVYQGYHEGKFSNTYGFDQLSIDERTEKLYDQFTRQTFKRTRDPVRLIEGDKAFADSLKGKIGQKICFTIKKNRLFADEIVSLSIKPNEDLE